MEPLMNVKLKKTTKEIVDAKPAILSIS